MMTQHSRLLTAGRCRLPTEMIYIRQAILAQDPLFDSERLLEL